MGTDVLKNNINRSSPGCRLSGCVAENNIIHASGGSRLSGCVTENDTSRPSDAAARRGRKGGTGGALRDHPRPDRCRSAAREGRGARGERWEISAPRILETQMHEKALFRCCEQQKARFRRTGPRRSARPPSAALRELLARTAQKKRRFAAEEGRGARGERRSARHKNFPQGVTIATPGALYQVGREEAPRRRPGRKGGALGIDSARNGNPRQGRG